MNISEYKLMSEAEYDHWWWLGRKIIIERIIENHVDISKKLKIGDVGAGSGGNISILSKFGDVTALETNDNCIKIIKNKYRDSVKVEKWQFFEPVDQKFDLILLADVLEHIENDKKAIKWIYDHLNNNGYTLITVPAHRYLWTQMDEVAQHFRRYNRKEFKLLFSDFKIIKLSYYNFFLFPVKLFFTIIVNLMNRFKLNNPSRSYNDVAIKPGMGVINKIMKHILFIEAQMLKYINLPFGVSMIILVKKISK